MRAMLLVAMVAGCGARQQAAAMMPHQAEAIQMIWIEGFHAWEPIPSIAWVNGDPECDTFAAGRVVVHAAHLFGTGCDFGITGINTGEPSVTLVRQDHQQQYGPIALSYMVHELVHAWRFDEVGDPDTAHKSGYFGYDFVGPIDSKLIASGF